MKLRHIKLLLGNMAIAGLLLSASSALLTYFKTWLLSSSFSSSEFGFYIYITTIIGWIVTISTSGLNNGLLGYLITSGRKGNSHAVVRLVLALSFRRGLLGVIAAFIVFIALLSPSSNDEIVLYFSIVFLIPFSVAIYSLNSVLIVQNKVTLNNSINTFILNGCSVLLLIFFAFRGLDYYGLTISVFIPTLVAYVVLTKTTKCTPFFGAKDGFDVEMKSVVARSNHMLFSGLLYAFWIKAESFFLNIGCGSSCVAHFYIPFQFAFLLTMVNTVIYGIVSSRLSNQSRDSNHQERLYNSAALFGFCVNFIGFIFIYTNSSELLSIFGNEYNTAEGVVIIKLLSASFLIYSYFGSTAEIYLNMLGRHKYLLYSSVFTALISLLANITFTLKYGSMGAAFSFVLTIISTSIIRNYFVEKYLHVGLSRSFRVIVYIFVSIFIMELGLSQFKHLSYFYKIIASNSLLLVLLFVFLAVQHRNIREHLKFIGLIERIN